MGQNVLCQSDCSIYKIKKSLEQMNEKGWFFACRDQFKKIKFWSIVFWVGMLKHGCDHSGYETLKLNVS